jgi:hypothetical protein
MGKYEQLQRDVFSVFAQPSWVSQNIKTFPSDVLVTNSSEYVRVSVLPQDAAINSRSAAGLAMIEIFTAANQGPMRASVIADKLDEFLLGKSISVGGTVTQFNNKSSLSPKGPDKTDTSLVKSLFSITFNHFGVF